MARTPPATADFTAYNSPVTAMLTGVGASWITANNDYNGDTNWHGYTRPWSGYSRVRVWANVMTGLSNNRENAMLGVLRQNGPNYNMVGMWCGGRPYGQPLYFGERWTMPGTFSALTGAEPTADAGGLDYLDSTQALNAFEIRYSAGTLSFWGSPGYPENDMPWINRGTNEAVATWLGGDPTEWGYFVRRAGATAGNPLETLIQWYGWEEVP